MIMIGIWNQKLTVMKKGIKWNCIFACYNGHARATVEGGRDGNRIICDV